MICAAFAPRSTAAPMRAIVHRSFLGPIALLLLVGSLSALEVQVPVAVGTNPNVPRVTIGDGSVATLLKAIASGGTAPYSYTWDVDGNGTADIGPLTADANGNMPASHVYNVADSRTFIAKVTVTDSAPEPAQVTAEFAVVVYAAGDVTDEIRNQKAIDDGLWYLHRNLTYDSIDADSDVGTPAVDIAYFNGTFDGTPLSINSEYTIGTVGIAVQAFQNKGFRVNTLNQDDPYVIDVKRMHNYLLSKFVLMPGNIDSLQNHTRDGTPYADNADANDNDIALTISASHMPYVVSLAIIAIATSQVPDEVADAGLQQYVGGRRYQDIAQDVADMFAFAQIDSGAGRGSWRYQTYFDNAGSSPDGSQQHFVATALQWSRDLLGVTIPDFVIEELRLAIPLTQNTSDYGFGYSSASHWVNTRKTAGNLGTFALTGTGTVDLQTRYDNALLYVANNWGPTTGYSTSTNSGPGYQGTMVAADEPFMKDHYTMYSLMKGARSFDPPLELFTPSAGGPIDWYQEYSSYIRETQRSDGSWLGSWLSGSTYGGPISTAAMVEVLEVSPLEAPPVAHAEADAIDVAGGATVTLTHDLSYHLGVGRSLVSFTWDFGDGGASPDYVSNDLGEEVPFTVPNDAGDYVVTLTVEDDLGDTDSTQLTVSVTIQNHAPVASAGPPGGYTVGVGGTVQLDGSASYDPDEGIGDFIASYAWDTDSDSNYDDLTGATPSFAIPAGWTPGNYTVALRVTDDGNVLGGPAGLSGVATANIQVVPDATPPELEAVARATPPDGVHVSAEGVTNADELSFELTFDEPVTALPADFVITTTGTVTTDPDVTVSIDGNVVTVTITGIAGDGTLALGLADPNGIVDGVGNAGATLDAALSAQVYIIDNIPPAIQVTGAESGIGVPE